MGCLEISARSRCRNLYDETVRPGDSFVDCGKNGKRSFLRVIKRIPKSPFDDYRRPWLTVPVLEQLFPDCSRPFIIDFASRQKLKINQVPCTVTSLCTQTMQLLSDLKRDWHQRHGLRVWETERSEHFNDFQRKFLPLDLVRIPKLVMRHFQSDRTPRLMPIGELHIQRLHHILKRHAFRRTRLANQHLGRKTTPPLCRSRTQAFEKRIKIIPPRCIEIHRNARASRAEPQSHRGPSFDDAPVRQHLPENDPGHQITILDGLDIRSGKLIQRQLKRVLISRLRIHFQPSLSSLSPQILPNSLFVPLPR